MSEYVSLSNLQEPDFHEESLETGRPLIAWGMPLPAHLDTEKIEVNFSRLGLLHKVGAFTASMVEEHQGKTSEPNSVAGINADGSAVAGVTATLRAPKSDSALIDHPLFSGRRFSENYGKPVVVHSVNRPEIVQNVISRKEDGLNDEQAWAKELDIALRTSFRVGGRMNLKDRINNFRKTCVYIMAANLPLDAATSIETGEPSIYPAIYGCMGCSPSYG